MYGQTFNNAQLAYAGRVLRRARNRGRQMFEVVLGPRSSKELTRVQRGLVKDGYARTSDAALGLSPDLHRHIDKRFYEEADLGPEVPGMSPPDRLRVVDALGYERRRLGKLAVVELENAAMPARPEAPAPRQYNRVHALGDVHFRGWVANVLSMIPPEYQHNQGDLRLNFARTLTQVVEGRHQDGTDIVALYVAARHNIKDDAATTTLHPIENPEKTVDETLSPLLPGDWLIFKDARFMHNVTPIEPAREGEPAHRDAIVALLPDPAAS